MKKFPNAMTVGELKRILRDIPNDVPVVASADYGDYCHTMQALPILGCVPTGDESIRESAYSRSGFAFDEDEAEPCWPPEVVVLRTDGED